MDDDEVDVLGDFNLESLLSKNESTSCYNVEGINCDFAGGSEDSHWVMEPTDGQWYDRQGQSDAIGYDEYLDWTDKEKYLLEKGLELFGQSWSRLSQYIGSKTAHQVKAYLKSSGTGGGVPPSALVEEQVTTTPEEDFLTDDTNLVPLLGEEVMEFGELIDDVEIPASIEEVITAVSTAQPTVRSARDNWRRRGDIGRNPRSQTRRRRNKVLGVKTLNRNRGRPRVESKFNIIKDKPVRKLPSAPLSTLALSAGDAEEIVKIKYDDSSEDSEVDIEDNEDAVLTVASIPDFRSNPLSGATGDEAPPIEMEPREEPGVLKPCRYSVINQQRLDSVRALPLPSCEFIISDPSHVSEQEMQLHPEFFPESWNAGKLRSRYLKIRNHIVDCWKETKPNYLTKTWARSGLKNCGDVNLIGRVHAYLEQIGAINFGCYQCHYNARTTEQVDSSPPHVEESKVRTDDVAATDVSSASIVRHSARPARGTRIRKKRVWSPDTDEAGGGGRRSTDRNGGGGLTMTHDDTGAVTVTHVQTEPAPPTQPAGHHQEARRRRNTVELIPCRRFGPKFPATYRVVVNLSCLLLGEVHSQSSPGGREVMGLLGGCYDPTNSTLNISVLAPCKAAASTSVHCDMCPVSQCEVAERLIAKGHRVVGWYHSHPGWEEHPSRQDIISQSALADYFQTSPDGCSTPFTALIFSPQHSAINFFTLEVIDGCQVPFALDWTVISPGELDPDTFISDLKDALDTTQHEYCNTQLPESVINHCIGNLRRYFGLCSEAPLPAKDVELFEEVCFKIRQMFSSSSNDEY